jgi:uncharacterized protein (TIGR00251 family)
MSDTSMITHKAGGVHVKVKVITGSAVTGLAGIKNNELVVKLNARPEKGKANIALIDFFSKLLGVAKTEIRIARGNVSRHKIIFLPEACYAVLINLVRRQQTQ